MGILNSVGGGCWYHRAYEHKGRRGRLYYMCSRLTEVERKKAQDYGYTVLNGHLVTSRKKRAIDMLFIEY